MPLNLPNILTLMRLAMVPLLAVLYFLPYDWAPAATTSLFILAAITDWYDGQLARRLNMMTPLGAFMDPVADKLIVGVALILLVSDSIVQAYMWNETLFVSAILVIIGRELTVSALREWMAEMGMRAKVKVSWLGKLKTVVQMVAIVWLLYRQPLWLDFFPAMKIGEVLLYLAAILTLVSMLIYLKAAWPALMGKKGED